jgi:Ca-activated chloride channel homolog
VKVKSEKRKVEMHEISTCTQEPSSHQGERNDRGMAKKRFPKTLLFLLSLISGFLFFTSPVSAQQQKPKLTTRVLFIFDASFSMSDRWQENIKMDIAKKILTELIDSIRNVPDLEMGLRTLGADHSLYPERDCHDTRLVVPIGANSANKIEYALEAIQPMGTTPLAYTLGQCANDFTPCDHCHDVIILLTDGIEECGGDPCEVSKQLHAKGIVLRPFIIGIGNEDFSDTYNCVGKFFDVKKEENFKNVLKIVISQALNNTTAQVSLMDAQGKPTETDVPMTFYDQSTGKRIYNFMHTLNEYGNPDTISLDPNLTYHLVVHTIPEVDKRDVTLISGKHNIIPVDAPQGYLHVNIEGENDYRSLAVLVKKHDDDKTINVQYVESTEKYLTGKYDLEILTLPRIYQKGVKISERATTTVTIPEAGIVTINRPARGPASIFADEAGKMVWVCNRDAVSLKTILALEPGVYHIVFRPEDVKQTVFTVDNSFEVKPGTSSVVNIE